MALGGVVPLVWSAREWIARGGAPEEPLFRGPQVRAKVNEGARLRRRAGDRYTARPAAPARPRAARRAAGEPPPTAPLPKRLNIPRRDWRAP